MSERRLKLVQSSIEYLYVDIRADRVLDDQAIYISISAIDAPVEWIPAVWLGNPGKFRTARILYEADLQQDTYWVFARIDDISESPIFQVGRLEIV